MQDLLFYIFAALTLLCGALVVLNPFSRNPVTSAMFLVLTMVFLSGLFVLLHAFFLAAVQILVYAGAVMVLFLFVIMLLNLGAPQALREKSDPKMLLGGVLGLGLFAIIGSQILPNVMSATQPQTIEGYGSPAVIGRALFTDYVFPFEAVSILLLIGIVGSILLPKRRI